MSTDEVNHWKAAFWVVFTFLVITSVSSVTVGLLYLHESSHAQQIQSQLNADKTKLSRLDSQNTIELQKCTANVTRMAVLDPTQYSSEVQGLIDGCKASYPTN